MRRNVSRLVVLSLVLGVSPFRLSAQSLLVQVNQRSTGEPIPGAFVSLRTESGEFVRGALTNDEGRYLFLPGSAGVFTIRAEMIGFSTIERIGVRVAAGESVSVAFDLPFSAIRLEGIEIRGEERCRLRPEEATATARVWEEARKALLVQNWAENEGAFRFGVLTYARELEPQFLEVRSETRRAARGVSRNPIRSLPAETLAREGYIQEAGEDEYDYFAPDASVLLSDSFLDTHCMKVTRADEEPDLVGLSFEPTKERNIPDIEGTFWLDSESLTLDAMEYRYTWSPWPDEGTMASGRLEFEALPNGVWIVRRWWIRIPLIVRRPFIRSIGGTELEVGAFREVGGEITDIATLDRVRIAETSWGTVEGTVWDSLRGEPLPGARVFLEGTNVHTNADSAGAFILSGLSGGRFRVGFGHPRLDSLGLELPGVEVSVEPGQTAKAQLAIPTRETLAMAACENADEGVQRGILVGRVVAEGTDDPIPGARLRLSEISPAPGGKPPDSRPSGRERAVGSGVKEAVTDLEGWFQICDAPVGRSLLMEADFAGRARDTILGAITPGESRRFDLTLPVLPGFLTSVTEVTLASSGNGTQGVQGRIMDRASDLPVSSAEVVLATAGGRTVARGTTNDRGAFRLLTRLSGAHTLSVSALGYGSFEMDDLGIEAGKLSVVEVELAPEALALDPLVVTATPRNFSLEMKGFYDRQELSGGFFITPEVIEERMPRRATQLFLEVPGATIVQDQSGKNAVWFRINADLKVVVDPFGGGATAKPCWPRVFLDGMLMEEGGREMPALIDELIHPMDIAGIEVYRSPAEIPGPYGGASSRCGVLVIWSKTGAGGGGGS